MVVLEVKVLLLEFTLRMRVVTLFERLRLVNRRRRGSDLLLVVVLASTADYTHDVKGRVVVSAVAVNVGARVRLVLV